MQSSEKFVRKLLLMICCSSFADHIISALFSWWQILKVQSQIWKFHFQKKNDEKKANPIFCLYNFKPELTPGKGQAKIQQHEHLFEHLHLHVSLIMTKANTDILF